MDTGLDKKFKHALVQQKSGRDGVMVSLQYQHRMESGSRRARRKQLLEKFAQVAREVDLDDDNIDPGSLSVSGQTIEAFLPLSQFNELVQKFSQQNIRIDPLIDYQVLQD